jgi:hypothetical protein
VTPLVLKLWRKRNKRKVHDIKLRNYNRTKEKILAQQKEYRKKNKEKVKANKRRYWVEKKIKEAEAFLKRREIEKCYKLRRKEIAAKRKADGYYRTDEMRAKKRGL